jgi:tRNA G18 (ribose-2'-O)-methylase SpoU
LCKVARIMRGYFGIGVEGISKALNVGAVYRTAHAFDASCVFSVHSSLSVRELNLTDTSGTAQNVPFYRFESAESLLLPPECRLVGVEITDDAIELPSFHHPRCAAYVLGPERGSLSKEMVARCDHVVRIPTKFSINVGLAGALVLYDRLISLGRFAPRAAREGAPTEPAPVPEFGPPLWVRKQKKRERESE